VINNKTTMRNNKLKLIAVFMATLIAMLPVAFAEEFNRVYDLNGNLVSDGKYYREYNGLNQLTKVYNGSSPDVDQLLEFYRWHPIEEKIVIKKVYHNGILNSTVYYPNENYVYIRNESGEFDEIYVKQEGILVAQIDSDGNKQAIHNDHLGSVSLLTDSNGSVLEETFYSPYGEILEGGSTSRFDYEGKEFDSVVEDYDFNFRKYDSSVPIFNQPDTLLTNVYDPQSLNRYSFERNNPFGNVDEDGHQPQSQASGQVEPTIFSKVVDSLRIRYIIGRFKLTGQLNNEYDLAHPDNSMSNADKSCYGGGCNDRPHIEVRIETELRENFFVLVNEENEIIAYMYRGQELPPNDKFMQFYGFKKSEIKAEKDNKFNQVIQRLKQQELKEEGNKENEGGEGGGGGSCRKCFVTTYDKLKKIKKSESKKRQARLNKRLGR
jgi:RHS repeat-associated protein